MSTKKYIYIVQVTRQLSIDILNNFSKQGAEITLITGIVESNYQVLDANIKVKYLNKYNNTSGFKRLFTWSLFTIRSFFYVLFKSKNHELILVTTPPFIVFLGLFFKRMRNQNYHLVIWDLYPDVLVNFGVLKETSFIIKRWKKLNEACFKRATNVFTLGQHLSDAIKQYTNESPVIIQNWTNTDFIKPISKNENSFAIQHQLTEKFVVMYSGNLGITHDIESILLTAEILKENTAIQFVIIGDGAKREKTSNFVKEKKLTNVLLLPYQGKETLPYSLASADIGVVTLSQGAENISVPSKTYYMLAAGTAILALASCNSELGLLIDKYSCGKVFEHPKPEAIANYILHLMKNKEELITLKENSRIASFDYSPQNAKLYYDYICKK